MPVKTELNLPVYLFLFFCFLSTLVSAHHALSFNGFFLKVLEWVLVYFMMVEVISKREDLKKILIVMLFSIGLTVIDAAYQYITGADFIRGRLIEDNRLLTASFATKNSFAGWLVVMMPFSLGVAYSRWFSRRLVFLIGALTALMALCLIFSYSRGGWIGALSAILFFGILKRKKLLLFIVIILTIAPFVISHSVKEHITSIISASEIGGVRTAFWREALAIVEDFPMLGCGLNTYAAVGPHYAVPGGAGCYPHNSYLQMASEIGLLGLGAFLWIIASLFKVSMANLKKIGGSPHAALTAGLLAGLFGFMVHSFFDVNFYSLQLGNLMWFVMGLIIAAQKIA